jgi:signal transduction histidine kinase
MWRNLRDSRYSLFSAAGFDRRLPPAPIFAPGWSPGARPETIPAPDEPVTIDYDRAPPLDSDDPPVLKSPPPPRRATLAAPLLVPLVALLLTGTAAAAVWAIGGARDAARFEHASDGATDRITSRLGTYITLLRAGAGFISASEDVTLGEFERFVERFRVERLYPGIQGVGYSARIAPAERDSLFGAQRAAGFDDFRIWPEDSGEEDHSIVYLFPLDARNRAAIGFNMYSEPTRRRAMQEARDSGRTAMSGRVTLVQEIEGRQQAGFLIYTPVYRGGGVPSTVEERRRDLVGFVYAPFRGDDLFEGIFGLEEQPLVAFRVFDALAPPGDGLLHDSEDQQISPAASPRFRASREVNVAGHPWRLEFASTAAFEAGTRQWPLLLILGLGLGGTLLLFFVTEREVAARLDAETLAKRLQETSGALESQIEEVRLLHADVEVANQDLAEVNQALMETNRRLVELTEEADAARDEATRANQAKSAFLAAMSHEFRTPLNAIMGYADLLDMGIHGPVTPEQREALGRIRRSQTHLLGLINDILNYAKLEAGRVEVRQETVPLGPLVADLRAMTEPQVRERGLTASYEVCGTPEAVVGDADKIQQILLNLMTNAIKFTEPGGRIGVYCEPNGQAVQIRVLDTGVGIPAEQLPSIFDPFVQVDRHAGRGSQQGVGLGLAISRDLAELMQGELTVESQLGSGTIFTLTLPRAGAAAPSAAERERSPTGS